MQGCGEPNDCTENRQTGCNVILLAYKAKISPQLQKSEVTKGIKAIAIAFWVSYCITKVCQNLPEELYALTSRASETEFPKFDSPVMFDGEAQYVAQYAMLLPSPLLLSPARSCIGAPLLLSPWHSGNTKHMRVWGAPRQIALKYRHSAFSTLHHQT